MVKVHISFQIGRSKRDLGWPSRNSVCILMSISILIFSGTRNTGKTCHFTTRVFLQKSTGCHAMSAKSLFSRQIMERKYSFWELFWTDSSVNLKGLLTHAFDRVDRTTERSIFKNRVSQVLRDFYHESILPVKAYSTMNISRIILHIAKSFGCHDSTCWDLYCSSYDWLEKSTKIWAIVGERIILLSSMTRIHRKGPWRVRIESIKNSSERFQKVESNRSGNKHVMSV